MKSIHRRHERSNRFWKRIPNASYHSVWFVNKSNAWFQAQAERNGKLSKEILRLHKHLHALGLAPAFCLYRNAHFRKHAIDLFDWTFGDEREYIATFLQDEFEYVFNKCMRV
jgi:hypothetical protein